MTTLFFITFCISCTVTLFTLDYARKRLIDIPVLRSSHTIPTPRGGGLGIVVATLISTLSMYIAGQLNASTAFPVLIGGTALACVGFIDDHRQLSVISRLIVQCSAASILVALSLPPFSSILMFIPCLFCAVWLFNLSNFMDGIDGLATCEAITVCLGIILIAVVHGSTVPCLAVITIAASAGFLIFNLPPARIFMGDVGSVFLGAIYALFLFNPPNGVSTASVLILLAVFITDSTITLVVRIKNKARWTQPHRSHAYQHLAQRTSHGFATTAISAINIFWLTPLAVFATHIPHLSIPLTLLAYIPIVICVRQLNAGYANDTIHQNKVLMNEGRNQLK
ncbi:MraY family glycosyltransferase [Desulfovibrio inopinatus]|uniref:MraY family glycosyltransferase n=1 Tax=Desulfovibrio inopinatus TaxID=102109 RepID=UPI000411AB2E|nr:glycosyltransferase family 4 protein [Desulfovibrio inopinatus]